MHTCTHAHMHTCTHAHMHTCTHAHVHTCTHAHRQMMIDINGYPELPTNIYIDGTAIYAAAAHAYGQLVFRGMYVCMYVCMYVSSSPYVHIYVYVHVLVCVCNVLLSTAIHAAAANAYTQHVCKMCVCMHACVH